MDYAFEWDEAKRAANLAKHGIDFAEVARIDFGSATIIRDRRQDYGELRFRAFVRVDGEGRVLAFIWRASRIRVISLRRAREKEMKRHGT